MILRRDLTRPKRLCVCTRAKTHEEKCICQHAPGDVLEEALSIKESSKASVV